MDSNGSANSSSESAEPKIALDILPLHSTNLLTVLDETSIIQYGSPSIERLYGFEQDELVGEQVAEYFHPDDRESVVNAFRAVVTSDASTVEAVEYRHEQADGTYMWVESVASANPHPTDTTSSTRAIFLTRKNENSNSKPRTNVLRSWRASSVTTSETRLLS